MNRLLLLDKDLNLKEGLNRVLKNSKYTLDSVTETNEFEILLKHNNYKLLLINISTGEDEMINLCKGVVKKKNIPAGFIIPSWEKYNAVKDIIKEDDDFIISPFKEEEFYSKIRAVLKKANKKCFEGTGILYSGNIKIDTLYGRVTKDGELVKLTATEYRLLCFLVRNEECVITKNQMLEKLWDSSGNFVDDNTLSIYIKQLREKLEDDPSNPVHIVRVKGNGYKWNDL
ncbi:MAG: response regulator transcription factor [Clostridia bacterium]|nr:response regulator transcription factor [Clostridia bacterium]